jgi:hypothetical protein
MTSSTTVRQELGVLPARIARLPIDSRGYPVPWFVLWLSDGTPEFRAMDPQKWSVAVRDRRCWVCGDRLGRYLAFVTGPMCVISGTTGEPPCHHDCAVWSACFCPFLSRPQMRRREGDFPDECQAEAAGFAIRRNPGVTAVLVTERYTVFRADVGGHGNGGRLIEVGPPVTVQWFTAGRAALRAEILASIDGGYPLLDSMCDQDRDPIAARHALTAQRKAAERWLPTP